MVCFQSVDRRRSRYAMSTADQTNPVGRPADKSTNGQKRVNPRHPRGQKCLTISTNATQFPEVLRGSHPGGSRWYMHNNYWVRGAYEMIESQLGALQIFIQLHFSFKNDRLSTRFTTKRKLNEMRTFCNGSWMKMWMPSERAALPNKAISVSNKTCQMKNIQQPWTKILRSVRCSSSAAEWKLEEASGSAKLQPFQC